MNATAVDPLVGRVLDRRYRIDSRIARGGMATVYVSHDLKLDRTVALKVMHPNLAQDDDFVRRFIHEAKSAAALSHPNIVSVFDQGTDGANVFLAMEYVPGRTLRDVLTQRGRLGPRETLGLMQPVLAALAAAHRAGLVHRDVKPENVLVMDDGRIKVADFGLARAESAGKQTKTGVLLGTVGYLAPEQVLSGTADARADVYAAGIMLFELLTGRRPYEGDTPLAVAYKHVNEVVPLPSGWLPGLPAQLDALVATATSRDPARRPPDAGHFLAAVTEAHRALSPEIDHTLALSMPPGPVPVPRDGTVMIQQSELPGIAGPPEHTAPTRQPAVDRMGALFTSRYLLVLLGVLAIGIIVWAAWYQTSGQYDKIPNSVIGMSMTDAKARLEATGLTVKTGKGNYDAKIPKDHVLRVSPEPGSRYKAGDSVTLYPSKGRFPIEVPDVTGKTLEQAKAALQVTGLTPGVVERDYSNTVPKDMVVRTEPGAHDKQQPEEPVTIVLSNGIKLQDLVGWKREDAENWLRQRGLNPQIQEQDDRGKDPNTVLAMSPPAGSGVSQGDTITLQVNKKDCVIFGFFCDDGNDPPVNPQDVIPVPDVRGQPVHDAAQALQNAGFRVTVRRRTDGDRVLAQSPAGGQPAPRGTRILLVR
ncbi:MAG TPA: Stk1 family PASTA domain-containing Ser/Thr kinase [Streptosporangiaceae bacterium]|nr:Stk1 family PASTA domain-containing Ser/Thr kinase [Streptosporangiaceae bacterium]